MWSISYKAAITSVFLLLSLLGTAGVLYDTHTSTSAAFLRLSSEIVRSLNTRTMQRISADVTSMDNNLRVNATLASNSDGILAARNLLLPVFWQQLISTPAVRNVYIADRDGNLVQADQDPSPLTRIVDRSLSPLTQQLVFRKRDYSALAQVSKATDYDPREQNWYRNSVPGRVTWSAAVYRFAFSQGQNSSQAQGITASLAVNDEHGQLRYVVAADFTLQEISDFLSQQHVTEAVAMFVVDAQDRLVAYPYQLGLEPKFSDDNAALPTVQALPQAWIQEAYANYRNTGKKTVKQALVTHTDGDTYLTTVTDLDPGSESGFRLVMIAPKSYLLRSANVILRQSMVVSLIILAISLFVIYLVAGYLSEPIHQLAANGRRIREFHFSNIQPIDCRWRDVCELSHSLGQISTQLRSLAKFVPAALLGKTHHAVSVLSAGTEVRELDLLLCGISDPARVFQTLDSGQLNTLLPGHFSAVADTVHDHSGTIDRYTGDGMRAFWGAPTTIDQGAYRACNSALLAQRAQQRVANDVDDEDNAELPGIIDFAIHHGTAIVGNFGCDKRLSYTASGEAALVGEALLRLNRRYGTRIIISEAVWRQVSDDFQCRPLDRLRPLDGGIDGPVMTVFELIAPRSNSLELDHRRFIDAYAHAFDAYQQQAWQAAIDKLDTVPASYRQDPSLRLLASRCRGLLDGSLSPPPPATDWDGVYPPPSTPA